MLSFGLNSFALLIPRNRISARSQQKTVHRLRSLRNITLAASLSSDIPESGPIVEDDAGTGPFPNNEELTDKYAGYLDNAKIVSIPLPLDVYLEEAEDGRVYVDEVIPGGNAERTGCVSEGDIIRAVSLPFGDALFPLPSTGGLSLVQEYIGSRGEGLEFRMALVPSDIEALKQTTNHSENVPMTSEERAENAKKIHIAEYPFAPRKRQSEKGGLDLEFLRSEGFEV